MKQMNKTIDCVTKRGWKHSLITSIELSSFIYKSYLPYITVWLVLYWIASLYRACISATGQIDRGCGVMDLTGHLSSGVSGRWMALLSVGFATYVIYLSHHQGIGWSCSSWLDARHGFCWLWFVFCLEKLNVLRCCVGGWRMRVLGITLSS